MPARANQPAATPAHAASSAHPPAQQRSTTGSLMRGAMVGLGAGMLTSLGLHALFGNRQHDNEGAGAVAGTEGAVEERGGLDRTDLIAAVGGAGAAMGAATLLKNRKIFNRSASTTVALHTPSSSAIRAPFQLPRRYMIVSILGALGGVVVNSMRKESNRLSEIPPTYEPAYTQTPPGQSTNKWGDEVQSTSTSS